MSEEALSRTQNIIRAAYTELNKFANNGEYEKAIKAVNRILGVASDDFTALHCKVVCLIQLSKFEEAYKFIEKNRLAEGLTFEMAYCEYRLNKPELALKTLDTVKMDPVPAKVRELRTQVLYRLERYTECFELYKEIIKNTNDEFEEERRTNLSAVAANMAQDESCEVPVLPEDSYEQFYNGSFRLSNRQNYAEAERKLRTSEKMCREMLEEDGGVTEEEVREEVDPIRVQLAYCLQMQGKPKEASAIYAECLRNRPKDPVLVAVASNNTVVINKDQNVFDSKKKMRLALSETAEPKLTRRQRKAIGLNNCLLALITNASEQVKQLCAKQVQLYPETKFQTLLIRCVQLTKDKRHKEAIELLAKHAAENNDDAFATKFATVQLLLMQGNRREAIDVLLSLGDAKYKPGIVSALVSLYLGTDGKNAASQLLKSAVEWYKTHNVSSNDLADMWRQAAEFHLRGGATETAASSLEELLKLHPNDQRVLAQLVIAYAQFNTKRALDLSNKLPKLETLSVPEEIDALESASWLMSTKAVKKPANGKTESSPAAANTTPASSERQRRAVRKRKGKLPKNYNAEVPPDPERWLPKYERTGFRKKRDRRAKDIIKGSQGISSGAADQYDMSNRVNQGKNSPATPAVQEPTSGPRQQHRKGGAHKKKKSRF